MERPLSRLRREIPPGRQDLLKYAFWLIQLAMLSAKDQSSRDGRRTTPMGKQDSTATRVAPVFDQLLAIDSSGESWLTSLMQLPVHGAEFDAVGSLGRIKDSAWGDNERGLPPPRSLLRWLAEHAAPTSPSVLNSSSHRTSDLRKRLLDGDQEVLRTALSELDKERIPESAWYIFEGPSKPDVYIATPEAIVVIEGKRTENYITTKTSWMGERHQMLRHIDCAWDVRGGRRVLGCLIVEGEGGAGGLPVPNKWIEAARLTVADQALELSLPHRSADERRGIANAFLGVTTWQQVCRTFALDWDSLPDVI